MPLTLGLVVLLLWNGFLAANNRTTIEYHEGVRANVQACRDPCQALGHSQGAGCSLRQCCPAAGSVAAAWHLAGRHVGSAHSLCDTSGA